MSPSRAPEYRHAYYLAHRDELIARTKARHRTHRATGVFRGWLCQNCNRALGYVHDSVELLQKMIEYLNTSRGLRLVKE